MHTKMATRRAHGCQHGSTGFPWAKKLLLKKTAFNSFNKKQKPSSQSTKHINFVLLDMSPCHFHSAAWANQLRFHFQAASCFPYQDGRGCWQLELAWNLSMAEQTWWVYWICICSWLRPCSFNYTHTHQHVLHFFSLPPSSHLKQIVYAKPVLFLLILSISPSLRCCVVCPVAMRHLVRNRQPTEQPLENICCRSMEW